MPVYSFTIVVDGVDLDEDATDAIYGGGLDDATIRQFAGWQLVDVDRQAGSYSRRCSPRSASSAMRYLGCRLCESNRTGCLRCKTSPITPAAAGEAFGC